MNNLKGIRTYIGVIVYQWINNNQKQCKNT